MRIGPGKIVLTVTGLILLCAGCEPKPKVFDMAAIDKVHKLLVLPLSSQFDPSAGPITSGMIASRLETARYESFHVIEGPALWRLAGSAPGSIPDATAAGIAGRMGAQAVLTGSVGYSIAFGTINFPGVASPDPAIAKRLSDFATRQGNVGVNLRILSVETGKEIYVHSAKTDGLGESTLLGRAVQKALEPLEKYLKSSQKKRKEYKDEKK